MKSFLGRFGVLVGVLCLALSAGAQAPAAPDGAPVLSQDQLEQLVGPIALYPDALVALILPASTVPSDVVLAARYLSANGDPAQIPNQSWDDSVKGLTRYPEVVQWLNQNLEWTTQLGQAFLAQPAGVMDAIQQRRAQAQAAGTLVNTSQQQVVQDDGAIDIEPANPDALYVPEYDSNDVYDEGDGDAGPLIAFGPAWPVGPWLNYGVDWHRHGLYTGEWRSRWDYRGRGDEGTNITNARPWQPNPARTRQAFRAGGGGFRGVSATKPLPGVVIPRGTRAAAAGNVVSTPGRDFTGRAGVRPEVVAPEGGVFSGYRRGNDARAASVRGQLSRQPEAAPEVYRPPAASFSRPAPEHFEERPSFSRPEPASGAFHMSGGGAAQESSARGAESRGRR